MSGGVGGSTTHRVVIFGYDNVVIAIVAGKIITPQPVFHHVSEIFQINPTVAVEIGRNTHHAAFLARTSAGLIRIPIGAEIDPGAVAVVFRHLDSWIACINTGTVFIVGGIVIISVIQNPLTRDRFEVSVCIEFQMCTSNLFWIGLDGKRMVRRKAVNTLEDNGISRINSTRSIRILCNSGRSGNTNEGNPKRPFDQASDGFFAADSAEATLPRPDPKVRSYRPKIILPAEV